MKIGALKLFCGNVQSTKFCNDRFTYVMISGKGKSTLVMVTKSGERKLIFNKVNITGYKIFLSSKIICFD